MKERMKKSYIVALSVIGGLLLLGVLAYFLLPSVVVVPPEKVAVVIPVVDVIPKVPEVVFAGITSVSPLSASKQQSLTNDIIVTFDEPMDSLSINDRTFMVKDSKGTAVSGAITSDSTLKIWTFNPTSSLNPNFAYTVTITTGAKGVSGNSLIKNFVWSFSTITRSYSGGGSSSGAVTPPVVPPVTAASGPLAVNLGAADNFAILSYAGISDANPSLSAIVGNMGVQPAAGSFITGVSCTKVTGTIYDNNAGYTGGFDSNVTCLITNDTFLTAAVGDRTIAYNDARGRTAPAPVTELGTGDISGMTLVPGLYKWSTNVLINSGSPTGDANGVTLACQNADDTFIFQIAQQLIVGNGAKVTLSGPCQAKNIVWQVDTQTTLGTTAVFNGNILSGTAVVLNSGAVLNGRAFSETAAVTLDNNAVTKPN